MARADEPRLTIRFSRLEYARVAAAAAAADVSLGALVREAAVRFGPQVAQDVSAGRVRLRRRSSAAPVRSTAAPSPESS